ncbi:hypothetical protein BJX64DRAFT_81434 [Aspergillus heterothallicus]
MCLSLVSLLFSIERCMLLMARRLARFSYSFSSTDVACHALDTTYYFLLLRSERPSVNDNPKRLCPKSLTITQAFHS